MSTEKRLIDANAFKVFLEGVRQDYLEEDTFSSDFAACVIETVQDNYLDIAPTVDAVEVVRCKDCKSYVWDEWDGAMVCDRLGRFIKSDDFCSCGERRHDEALQKLP